MIEFLSLQEFWDTLVRIFGPEINIEGHKWSGNEIQNTRTGHLKIRRNRDPKNEDHIWIPATKTKTEEGIKYAFLEEDLLKIELWYKKI